MQFDSINIKNILPVTRIESEILAEERVSILFFTIYTIYRYTEITDFFKFISCSIHIKYILHAKLDSF